MDMQSIQVFWMWILLLRTLNLYTKSKEAKVPWNIEIESIQYACKVQN